MLFLQKRGGLLRLKMNILKQLAQLQQLSVALAIGFKLSKRIISIITLYRWYIYWVCTHLMFSTTLGLLEALGHLYDLNAEVGFLALDLGRRRSRSD